MICIPISYASLVSLLSDIEFWALSVYSASYAVLKEMQIK